MQTTTMKLGVNSGQLAGGGSHDSVSLVHTTWVGIPIVGLVEITSTVAVVNLDHSTGWWWWWWWWGGVHNDVQNCGRHFA